MLRRIQPIRVVEMMPRSRLGDNVGAGCMPLFALSLNLSPKGGSKTLTILIPFAHDWEKGVGDEGNTGFCNYDRLPQRLQAG